MNRTLQLAFGSALLTLIAVGAVSYRGLAISSTSAEWVRHTYQVLDLLQQLRQAQDTSQTTLRNYLTPPDNATPAATAAQLAACRQAQSSVHHHLADLLSLTGDNPSQQSRLANLSQLTQRKFQFAEAEIQLRQSLPPGTDFNKDPSLANLLRVDRDQNLTAQIRDIVSAMQQEELQLLARRNADARAGISSSKSLLLLSTLLGLAIAVIAGWSVRRESLRRSVAEQRLIQTSRELERSNIELQQFAFVASHDLQEPLRTVASYAELLARRYRGKLDQDADEFIAFTVEGCKRMKTLIQDLLAYSRVSASPKQNTLAPTQPTPAIALQAALRNLHAAIQESGALITQDPMPALTADPSQLTQLFQNLIANAIKYRSTEPPRIHIGAQNQGHEYLFSVQDNGIGIEPQYFDKIFVLFQRLHGQQAFDGTGIGLAICRKIVDHLGGRIWVESNPATTPSQPQGSTFYFTLPNPQPSRSTTPHQLNIPTTLLHPSQPTLTNHPNQPTH